MNSINCFYQHQKWTRCFQTVVCCPYVRLDILSTGPHLRKLSCEKDVHACAYGNGYNVISSLLFTKKLHLRKILTSVLITDLLAVFDAKNSNLRGHA
jgi:hypothetical protein